jgi:amino acid transporter
MLVLIVNASEKAQQISPKNLAYIGLGLLALIVAIVLIKKVAKANGIIVFLVLAAAGFVVAVTWVYQRNEPKFLTPLIDHIAPWLPSAPTPYSQRPGADSKVTAGPQKAGAPAAAGQKPGTPATPQKPGAPPAQQKPASSPPSKVY